MVELVAVMMIVATVVLIGIAPTFAVLLNEDENLS